MNNDHVPVPTMPPNDENPDPPHYAPGDWSLDTTPNNIMFSADWCDAAAYCKWAGKRLCGAVGGGPADPYLPADADVSEWYNACSQGGKTAYPYGDSYDPNACTTAALAVSEGFPPYTFPADLTGTCHGTVSPYDQIVDLLLEPNGEWSSECDPYNCRIRGDNLASPDAPSFTRCDAASERSPKNDYLAFRCCANR